MGWLECEPSGHYHVAFRLTSHKFKRSIGTKKNEAEARLVRLVTIHNDSS